jgi:hypothetical protein
MKIYLAASWPQRERMRTITTQLGALGHIVTSNWIRSDDPLGMGPADIARDPGKAVLGCKRDLIDIADADLVAVFTDVPSSTGGFHVEYGYALALPRAIDIIGPKPNVFYAIGSDYIRHFPSTVLWLDQLHADKEK